MNSVFQILFSISNLKDLCILDGNNDSSDVRKYVLFINNCKKGFSRFDIYQASP